MVLAKVEIYLNLKTLWIPVSAGMTEKALHYQHLTNSAIK